MGMYIAESICNIKPSAFAVASLPGEGPISDKLYRMTC